MESIIFDNDFFDVSKPYHCREIPFTTSAFHDEHTRNKIASILVNRIPDIYNLVEELKDQSVASIDCFYDCSNVSMSENKWILGVFQDWSRDTHKKLKTWKPLSKGICEAEIYNCKYRFELFIGFHAYPELRKFTLYISGKRV